MLSEHFALAEFTVSRTASVLGIDNTPSTDIIANLTRTAEMLEQVRTLLRAPILITSGYRCAALNDNPAIGGARNSAHIFGQAADFICPGYGNPLSVCGKISESDIKFDQLIHEFDGWTHLAWAAEPRQEVLTIDANGTRLGLSTVEVV